MPSMLLAQFRRWVQRTTYIVVALAVVGILAGAWLWQRRPSLGDIDWPAYPAVDRTHGAVTMTWFGVATLLFDDGETQILIDGYFSRPSLADLAFGRPLQSDAATIDYVLEDYRIRHLAAIIPGHSHFDHAMDIGAIANRTSASIIGSETTANIARGAGVPEDQIVIAEDGGVYTFGEFTVTLIRTPHAPVGWGGSVPFDGDIDKPLAMPAAASAWRAGQSYTIVIDHPFGTTVVQGSAGFGTGALDDVHADVVLLGVQLLESLGKDYAERYWQALVTETGAKHVFPIHFDDFTRPFGETRLLPEVIDNFVDVAMWLEEFRNRWDRDTSLHLPVFGEQIVLYGAPAPDA